MLKKIILFGLFITAGATFAFAQTEGTRIRFKRGAASATVKGTVAKGGPDFYLIGAKAGQTMTVKTTGKVSFGIDSAGERLTEDDGNTNWSGELPADGDYKIKVFSSSAVQNYSLTISIAPIKTSARRENSIAASCLGEQLSLREAESEADMGGKRYGNYVFANVSTTPCALAGYPVFALLDKAGQPLSQIKIEYTDEFVSGADSEQNAGGAAVGLKPGETAWFQIFYNDGMALDRKKPVPISTKVKVVAPNTKRVFVLDGKIQACCGVEVSTVRGGLPQ